MIESDTAVAAISSVISLVFLMICYFFLRRDLFDDLSGKKCLHFEMTCLICGPVLEFLSSILRIS